MKLLLFLTKNQAEVAQLKHQILNKPIEGKVYETCKVSTSLPFLNRYLVPCPKEFADISSCTKVTPGISDGYVFQEHSRSAEYTPLYAQSRPLPVKNLDFNVPQSSSLAFGSVQAPVATASKPSMLISSSEVQSPQLSLYSSESSYSFQTTAGFDVKPPLYRDSPSFSYVTVRKPKPGTLESMTPPSLTTSVTWSTHLGPGREIPAIVGSQVGDSRVTYFSGGSRNTSNSSRIDEPVDAFIDKLRDGQETVFELSSSSLQTDGSVALLHAQEQQRLLPLELFKFTGKPIEWPKFIERFRDQIHNKTTLTDSDRMAYLFQNLDGEAKKAVESLGVTGHSYPTALKRLKRQFGNPNSVASAYLNDMLSSTYVPSNDRQALHDYYYQVKACTTWCVKMGQSAILQTPEYLSRATMRLPMNLRVRSYEHIDGRSNRSNLVQFEK